MGLWYASAVTFPPPPSGQYGPSQPPPPGYPAPGSPPPGYPLPGYAPRPKNRLAIIALVVSIASVLWCLGTLGFVGALLGRAARKQISRTGEDGDGIARVAVKVGWISFGISWGIIALVNLVGFVQWLNR